MYYLLFNGKVIDLSNVITDSKKIMSIIKFCGLFSSREELIEFLYKEKLIDNSNGTLSICIRKKDKYSNEVYYKEIPDGKVIVTKNDINLFSPEAIMTYFERHLCDRGFILEVYSRYGNIDCFKGSILSMLDYSTNRYKYSNYEESEVRDEMYYFLNHKLYPNHEKVSERTVVDFALLILNYENSKNIKEQTIEYDREEFLEPNDYLYYTPGITDSEKPDAIEKANELRLKMKTNQEG